jgi:hypothetical protein
MHSQQNRKYSCLLLRCCDLVNAFCDQKKKTEGGGVEFPCPSCQKVTRVGKKGVRLLHDNVYIRFQSAEVYLSDDDRDDDDDDDGGGGGNDVDDDTSTPKTFDASNNRLVLCKF